MHVRVRKDRSSTSYKSVTDHLSVPSDELSLLKEFPCYLLIFLVKKHSMTVF